MGSTRSKRGVLHTTCGLELFTQYLATLETRDGEAVDTLVSFTEPHKTTLDETRQRTLSYLGSGEGEFLPAHHSPS